MKHSVLKLQVTAVYVIDHLFICPSTCVTAIGSEPTVVKFHVWDFHKKKNCLHVSILVKTEKSNEQFKEPPTFMIPRHDWSL
jgi:hypothetical protein